MPWRDPIICTAPSKLLASNSFEIWQRQIQMYNLTPEIQSSQPGWEHNACSLSTCQACDSVWSPFRPMDGFPTHKRLSSPSISQRLMYLMLGTICCWKKSSLVSQPDALDSCSLLLWEAGPLRICFSNLHDTTKGQMLTHVHSLGLGLHVIPLLPPYLLFPSLVLPTLS